MAEKKETSKRRVLTPEEVEQITGGAIVRPTTSSWLVTMEGSDKEKDKGECVCVWYRLHYWSSFAGASKDM